MAETALKVVEKVEILTLQDNYIDMTAMDNNAVVTRAMPLQDGEIRASISGGTWFFGSGQNHRRRQNAHAAFRFWLFRKRCGAKRPNPGC